MPVRIVLRMPMKFIIISLILLISTIASGDEICTRLFESYVQKRQEYKLSLFSFTLKTEIAGSRKERDGSRFKTFTGRFSGTRVYSHRTGVYYTNKRYSGDSLFYDGPLWASGPLKIFVEQDEEANGPLNARDPEQLSRINIKTYKVLNCLDAIDDAGRAVYRFVVAPRVETEGMWYGTIDADPETLLTLAEVSTRTILSGRARSKFGGRMKEFNFVRTFQIVDGRVSIPQRFKTHAKSQWGQYLEVLIDARFELLDYKVGDR
jgi:hypothetical protein